MIRHLLNVLAEPDKQSIKRAQMIRTVLQVVQVVATLAILTINITHYYF
jgi:hypothetical protein